MELILLHRNSENENKEMLLNSHYITRIEEINNLTYVFMNNGENFIINESIDDVKHKIFHKIFGEK